MAAGLRVFRLGHQSLWVDEVYSWRSAGVGQRWGWAELREDVHGPLFSLLLHLWTRMAGDSEWALRLPSVLLGVLLVLAIARLAARWLGEETEVPAAWLAAGSPFLIWYSQEARNYTLLMLCACLAALALVSLARRVSVGGLARYLVPAWAGLLSNMSFALLAPAHLLGWMRTSGSLPRRLLRAAGVAVALLVLVSPWMGPARGMWAWDRLHPTRVADPAETPLRGAGAFHPAAIPFAAASFSVGYTLGPPLRELRKGPSLAALRSHALPLGLAAAVFGTLTLFGLRALRRRGRLLEGLLWLAVPSLILSYFAMQNFKTFHPRYVAVSVPVYLALLAAALADLPPRARAAAGAAVALLWAVSLGHHYFDPRHSKEDMRGAAALLAARAVPGETILAANTEALLFYYYRGPVRVVPYWLGWAADPDRCEERLVGLSTGASGVWVVLSRGEDLDPTGAFARHLESRHPDAEQFRFEGVRVWHLRRPAVPGPGPPVGSVRPGSPERRPVAGRYSRSFQGA